MASRWITATAAVLAAALALVLAGPASAAGTSCTSKAGRVFHRGAIAVFALKRGRQLEFLLCSSRFRRPHVFHQRRYEPDGTLPDSDTFKVLGSRLYFEDFVVATQREVLAWVDLRSASYREVHVPRSVEYDEISAVADNGSIAFVTIDERGHQIRVADARGRGLGKPRLAVNVVNGDMTPGSLTAHRGVIRWKTPYGPPRHAPLGGPAAKPVTVSSGPIACDGPLQVYAHDATRIFYRVVGNVERFYVCSTAIVTPKRFLEKTPYGSPQLFGFQETGTTLSFMIDAECDECVTTSASLDLITGKLTRMEIPPPPA